MSSIDAICTNLDTNKIIVDVTHTGLSDHTGQTYTIELPRRQLVKSFTVRRHLNKRNLSELKLLLAGENWEDVLNTNNVEEAYNNFINTITRALDCTCPYRKSQTTHRMYTKAVYNEETRILKEEFLKAQERYRLTGNQDDKANAARLKRTYDLKLKTLRQEANAEHIAQASNKSKAIWETINNERRAAHEGLAGPLTCLKIRGCKVTDATEIANNINLYFANIAEETLKNQLRHRYLEENPIGIDNPLSVLNPATPEEIQNIINSIKPKTSAGIDDISSKIIKICERSLITPMLAISNLSLDQGIFPSRLKIAKIYPKHKHGNRDESANYRPISLLPTASKIIEKIVLARLLTHLQQNGLLTDKQHGFTKGKSTTTAIADLLEYIVENIESGNTISSVYLDLSKAFDCLGHDLVLSKLKTLGVTETALKWFRSYLEGRTQLVETKKKEQGLTSTVQSDLISTSRGVPQGSVLGPVLFILFTNDLPKYMEPFSETIMYADDTVLLLASKNIKQLEIDTYISVSIAQQYCMSNDLVFNENKSKQMYFGRNRDISTELPNLQNVNVLKHLGLTLDNNLSWNTHIDNLCNKLSSAIFAIKRTSAVSSPEATKIAYHALFQSHLQYGIVLWGGASSGNLQRLLKIQKRALRVMTGLGPRDSCRNTFKDLKILTVISIYIMETVLFCVTKEQTRQRDMHGHNTRNASNFHLPAHRTATYAKHPSYAGMKMYNALPEDIKNKEPQNLKRAIREWLQEQIFYSLEEFFNWRDIA